MTDRIRHHIKNSFALFFLVLSQIKFEMPYDQAAYNVEIYGLGQSVQYPNMWTFIEARRLYHGEVPSSSEVLKRKITLQPFFMQKVKINITEGSPDILMKLELYGALSSISYRQNPVLDEILYRKGRYFFEK